MFYVTAFTPALVTLGLVALWAWNVGRHYWVFGFAALGCLLSAATPWIAMWYAWNILNDHTANIGAGLLALGQPLIAPLGAMLGAMLGALFGVVIEAAVSRRGGSRLSKQNN